MKNQLKTSTPAQLRKMTPEQIDTELFPLWAEHAKWSQWARKIQIDLKDESPRSMYRNEINRREGEKTLERYEAATASVAALIEPYDVEYARRPWTRYIAVGRGHLHRWHTCSFVYPTTQTFLLAESSGMDDAAVIKRYNYTACTHCFPDAPVANKPTLDTSIYCEGSGTYEVDNVNGSMRLYMPRGRCRKCNRMASVTSTGKLRKHKKED